MGKLNQAITSFLNKLAGSPPKSKRVSAIILAGGSSTRMGESGSKPWILLDGIPAIVHTLRAFDLAETVSEIVLVIREDERERYTDIASHFGIRKPLTLVNGGNSRQQSAKNGFLFCAENADFVAIHDGARCLITPQEIDSVCRAAFISGAAAAAAKVNDTVKLALSVNGELFIDKTVDRNTVYMAQTPQVFRTSVYHAATAVSEKDKITVTDDCSLAEHIEHPVRLVICSQNNLKLTTPSDIVWAEAILATRKNERGGAQ